MVRKDAAEWLLNGADLDRLFLADSDELQVSIRCCLSRGRKTYAPDSSDRPTVVRTKSAWKWTIESALKATGNDEIFRARDACATLLHCNLK